MAGWTSEWPMVANASRTTAWSMLDQLWQAAAEKRLCGGTEIHWPPANTPWGSGTITSLTKTSGNTWVITDSTKTPLDPGKTDDGLWWGNERRSSTLCTSTKYWVGVACNEGIDGGLPYFNGNYDLIIEDFDPATGDVRDLKPWKVIRGVVTDNTNNTITATIRIDDHVTAGYLASASSLVGKRFYLIRSGRLWWADKEFSKGRYPDFPNDPEEWRGSVDQGKVYDDGTGYLIETINKFPRDPYNAPVEPVAWTPDLFATREVLAYGGDLRRLTVTGNAGNVIFFGGLDHVPAEDEEAGTGEFEDAGPLVTDYTLSGFYSVVQAGRKAWPGRVGFAPFWWYGGAQDTLWTHDPSDEFVGRAMAFAADRVEWFELGSLAGDIACGDDASRVVHTDTLDNDMVSSQANMCNPAEQFYAPHLYKTLRGLQAFVEGIVGTFISPDLTTTGPVEIHQYSLARCFLDCGINGGTSTVTKTTSSVTDPGSGVVTTTAVYSFAVASAYFGQSVFFDVLKAGRRKLQDSAGVDPITGRVVVTTLATTTPEQVTANDTEWLSASVVYSAGWTRYHPLEFTHLYASTAFIPDIDTGDLFDPPSPLYPPAVADFCCEDDDPPPTECCKSCFGVGQWINRDPSMGFKTYDAYGYAINGGGNTFSVGDVVRYAGDIWHDPGTDQRREIGDDILDLPFWDRVGEFRHPREVHDALEQAKRGTVTAATKGSITDSTKHWLANWYGGGAGKVHAGLAVAGSTTTLTLPTDYADTSSPKHCWWQASRFVGFDAPFVGFTLEVDKVIDDVTVTFKMPITNVTGLETDVGNEPVIHFAAQDGFTVEADDVWRIVEPGTNLNPFRSRRFIVTPPAGDPVEIDITHNDGDTLFFAGRDDAFPIGSTYQIVEYTPGGVWQFATSKPTDGRAWQKIGPDKYWVQPVGTDPRGEPWHATQTENLPHKSPRKFGRILKGDYIYLDTFNELKGMLDRLWRTTAGTTYTNDPDGTGGDDPIPNYIEAGADDASDGSDGSVQHPALIAAITFQINGGIDPKEGDDVPPITPTLQDGTPYLSIYSQSAPTASFVSYQQRNAAVVFTQATLIPRAIEVVAYGMIDGSDPDEEDTVEETVSVVGGKTYIGEQHTGHHFNAGSMPLVWREYATVASFGASAATRQHSGMFNDPPVAVVPEENPGYWGVILSDSPTEMRAIGGGTMREGFAIRDTVAVIDWRPGLRFTS